MRDIDIIMKAMHDAQALLGAYIEPGPRDPEAVVQSMLEILDREDVIAAQDRLTKLYGRLKAVANNLNVKERRVAKKGRKEDREKGVSRRASSGLDRSRAEKHEDAGEAEYPDATGEVSPRRRGRRPARRPLAILPGL